MINPEILQMADKLKKTVLDNKVAAEDALKNIPEGAIKTRLTNLMKQATSGKLKPEDAHRELQKVIKDASTS